jgi:primosomal protein N' (replication factor Y)
VLIQTRVPSHHAVQCAVTHDYRTFVKEELEGRINPPYPPNLRLANIVFSGTNSGATADVATRGADWLRDLIAAHTAGDVALIGPAPCPVERVKTRWRWHVLLKSQHAGELTRVSRYFMERFTSPAAIRITLDRDPVALL